MKGQSPCDNWIRDEKICGFLNFFESFSDSHSIYKKNNIDLKSFVMKKKEIKRINLWVEDALYSQIKQQADIAYLKVATYTRQLIQLALKNNFIK